MPLPIWNSFASWLSGSRNRKVGNAALNQSLLLDVSKTLTMSELWRAPDSSWITRASVQLMKRQMVMHAD
jgi:hypothetical protein